MRLAVLCLFSCALALGGALPERAGAQDAAPAPVKPSSLVPHAPSANRVYGVPIQSQILHRVKAKPRKPPARPQ
jgi:hypothetical protein